MAFASAHSLAGGISQWTDSVAEVVVTALGWVLRPRLVQLIEHDGDEFSVHTGEDQPATSERIRIANERIAGPLSADLERIIKGSRVELVLRPSRFLFQPLQLPERATEFLEGIIRSQIERLTPWAASDAVFGWRKAGVANDRLTLTIAATARSTVSPFVQAVAELGPASIAVFTTVENDGAAEGKIKVFDQAASSMLDVRRMSRILLIFVVICVVAAGLSVAADIIGGNYIRTEQTALSRSILTRRAAMRIGDDTSARSATANLERLKHETAASVIVLEALSRVLPDHTYVTELRIDRNKAQIIGITRDAPGLIKLIEQSSHFSRATFFAPTTRAPTDPGERFHIEVRIEPVNSPRT